MPNFWSNRVIFFFIRLLFESFRKNCRASAKTGKVIPLFESYLNSDNEFDIPLQEKKI